MFFETLYTYHWPSLVLLCVFALCIGSFINVVGIACPSCCSDSGPPNPSILVHQAQRQRPTMLPRLI